MPRPQKQTVDWFPHYVSSGKTKFVLRSRFGIAGIGVWWALLELLCRTPGHAYFCQKPADWQFLVAETGLSEGETEELLNCLVDLEAIDGDLWAKRIIWCQHLVDEISSAYKDRKAVLPVKPGNNGVLPPINGIKPADNPQITLHEITIDNNTKETTKEKPSLSSSKKEPEADEDEIFSNFQKNIGGITPSIQEDIRAALTKFPPDWVKDAINEAGKQPKEKRSWKYITGILKNWGQEGRSVGPPGKERDSPEKFFKGKMGKLVQR